MFEVKHDLLICFFALSTVTGTYQLIMRFLASLFLSFNTFSERRGSAKDVYIEHMHL